MESIELKSILAELHPDVVFEEETEWLNMQLNAEEWLHFAEKLRNDFRLYFDYLFCLTCIDWKDRLCMVYHLSSTVHRKSIVVKCTLNRESPVIASVSHIWRTAEFHEREVFEMFGVQFRNHPDLRLLILPDGWEGRNPMRKDFEDPVNMIKL